MEWNDCAHLELTRNQTELRVIHAILKSIVRDHKSGHCDIRYYKAATLNVWKENQKNTKYRLL